MQKTVIAVIRRGALFLKNLVAELGAAACLDSIKPCFSFRVKSTFVNQQVESNAKKIHIFVL